MSLSLPLPAPPTGNRFALVTPDDDSAPVIIVTILSVIFTSLVFAVRLLVVKWKRHGYDDGVLGLGHLVALGQWIAIFIALYNGLGKSLEIIGSEEQIVLAKALFVGRILLLPALCFSKFSMLLLMRSLFFWESRKKTLAIELAMILVILWGIGATLAVSIKCSPYYVLGNEVDQCPKHVLRLQLVMITDIAIESLIFCLPPLFLYTFEIAKSKKWLVILAFAFRLPLAAFSTMYLLSTTIFIRSHSSGTALVPTVLWQEILLAYSLMSTTIPCLKSFVEGFTTGGLRYANDDSYEMGWRRKKFHRDAEQVKDVDTRIRNSFRSSRRLSGMRRMNEGASINSQASGQPIIGIAM
ncbi:uncharacterized protein PAC_08523 [Phialocephala subalpina]|uniref:Rhodopsin domain-containing protein n=1 Tax=Phialocephala subalpina TaxID=576137 RepID=A0A1L7X0U0_9HELO|nr:uncharacterized protein PAC_08523 [Phialocephala subalpina]